MAAPSAAPVAAPPQSPEPEKRADAARSPEDPYDLEGYVVAVSTCQRCRPSSPCKECEASIVVSNERRPADRTMTAPGNVKVIVPPASTFALGAKVKLRVSAPDQQPFQDDPCCSRLAPYVVRLVSPP